MILKNLFSIFFALCCASTTLAQKDAILAKDASAQIGKTVWVICDIKGVREGIDGKPNYLNVGAPYPNQLLSIVCMGDFKSKYNLDLASLKGKTVRVWGKVEMRKEKLEIKNPEKIILADEEVKVKPVEMPSNIAQKDSIEAKDARQYVGKTLWVKCDIKGTREAREEGKPNYLNAGAPYPNHIFTIVVIGDFKEKYDLELASLKDKTIWVQGKIELFKDAPQIKNPMKIMLQKP